MSDAAATTTDVLGTPLTDVESKLLSAYAALEALLEEELPPSARANVAEALATLWQAVNSLALTDARPGI